MGFAPVFTFQGEDVTGVDEAVSFALEKTSGFLVAGPGNPLFVMEPETKHT